MIPANATPQRIDTCRSLSYCMFQTRLEKVSVQTEASQIRSWVSIHCAVSTLLGASLAELLEKLLCWTPEASQKLECHFLFASFLSLEEHAPADSPSRDVVLITHMENGNLKACQRLTQKHIWKCCLHLQYEEPLCFQNVLPQPR